MKYSFLITLKKAVKQLVIAGLSVIAAGLMAQYPSIANYTLAGGLTVYTAINMLADYLKHKWGWRLP